MGISKLFLEHSLKICKIDHVKVVLIDMLCSWWYKPCSPDEAGSCKAGVRLQVFTLDRNEKKMQEVMREYGWTLHRKPCVCENLTHPEKKSINVGMMDHGGKKCCINCHLKENVTLSY